MDHGFLGLVLLHGWPPRGRGEPFLTVGLTRKPLHASVPLQVGLTRL